MDPQPPRPITSGFLGRRMGFSTKTVPVYIVVAVGLGVASWYAIDPHLQGPPSDAQAWGDWYQSQIHRSRALFGVICTALLVVGSLNYKRVCVVVQDFFGAATGPINLAIFRIVVFWLLLQTVQLKPPLWFCHMPPILRIAPYGLAWLDNDFFFNEHVVQVAVASFHLFGFAACVGFLTRPCAIFATILALYLLALPHFDGKVDHGYHHLVWFAALLSVSRCGDALSVDALIRAVKNTRGDMDERPADSRAYALPLRFVWLLFGVVYFFPGFWKLWTCGLYWAVSNNLKYRLYEKWVDAVNWAPAFRIDQYPTFLKAIGLGTIVFELGFILLVVFGIGRIIAMVSGLSFHWSTAAFMRIRFTKLQWCYVAFVNWERVFRAIGTATFRSPITVQFGSGGQGIERLVRCAQSLDLLGRITYVGLDKKNPRQGKSKKQHEVVRTLADPGLAAPVIQVSGLREVVTGRRAMYTMLSRVPLLWFLLPVIGFMPKSWFEVQDAESARVRTRRSSRPVRRAPSVVPTCVLGCILVGGNLAFGFAKKLEAWPMSCFPTFDSIVHRPVRSRLETVVLDSSGERIPIGRRVFGPLGSYGWIRLQRRILQIRDPRRQERYLKALTSIIRRGLPQDTDVSLVRFYRVVQSTIPEEGHRSNRSFVAEIQLSPQD